MDHLLVNSRCKQPLTIGTRDRTVYCVSDFDWDDEKNEFLKSARGISFEDMVFHIQNGDAVITVYLPEIDEWSDDFKVRVTS